MQISVAHIAIAAVPDTNYYSLDTVKCWYDFFFAFSGWLHSVYRDQWIKMLMVDQRLDPG